MKTFNPRPGERLVARTFVARLTGLSVAAIGDWTRSGLKPKGGERIFLGQTEFLGVYGISVEATLRFLRAAGHELADVVEAAIADQEVSLCEVGEDLQA